MQEYCRIQGETWCLTGFDLINSSMHTINWVGLNCSSRQKSGRDFFDENANFYHFNSGHGCSVGASHCAEENVQMD